MLTSDACWIRPNLDVSVRHRSLAVERLLTNLDLVAMPSSILWRDFLFLFYVPVPLMGYGLQDSSLDRIPNLALNFAHELTELAHFTMGSSLQHGSVPV